MHGHCRRNEGLAPAALREISDRPTPRSPASASARCSSVRAGRPKVAELLEEPEEGLLAFYRFPQTHWPKLRSTNPLERVNREIGRRADVVGDLLNDASAGGLAGALLIEQCDEWLVARRYLSAESDRPGPQGPGR